MKIILILIFVLHHYLVFGQILDKTYYPAPRPLGRKVPIDTCRMVVTYDFEFVKDMETMEKWKDRTVLEVGHKMTRYYSEYSEVMDSIYFKIYMNDWVPRNRLNKIDWGECVNWMKGNPGEILDAWHLDVTHNIGGNEILVSTRFASDEYQYVETLPLMQWEMSSEKESILGYDCFLAKASFRGREWKVWFTVDLPFGYGPWKFLGLPGTVLKAQDSQELFCWTAIGLEQPETSFIYEYGDVDIKVTDKPQPYATDLLKISIPRKKVKEYWKRKWLLPVTLLPLDGKDHGMMGADGKPVKVTMVPVTSKKYYPELELE